MIEKFEHLRITAEIEDDRLRLSKLRQRRLEIDGGRAIEINIGDAGLQFCDRRRARLVSRISRDAAKHAFALLAILALDLEANDRATRPRSELVGENVAPVLRRSTRDERTHPGQGLVDARAVQLDDDIARLEPGVDGLSNHMGYDELIFDQGPRERQRMAPIDKPRVGHPAMAIVERGYQTVECIDK